MISYRWLLIGIIALIAFIFRWERMYFMTLDKTVQKKEMPESAGKGSKTENTGIKPKSEIQDSDNIVSEPPKAQDGLKKYVLQELRNDNVYLNIDFLNPHTKFIKVDDIEKIFDGTEDLCMDCNIGSKLREKILGSGEK